MKVLIVGAAPTGLTTALELSRRGIIPTIIDRKESASKLSRAVGITPRSLELWSESGVDKTIIEQGIAFQNGRIFLNHHQALKVPFNSPDSYFHTLIGLPQDQTESVLSEALKDYSCGVKYSCELLNIEQSQHHVIAFFRNITTDATANEYQETFDLIVGADGVHSRVRQSVGIDYIGYDLPETWSIADIDSKAWPYQEDFCLYRLEKGKIAVVAPIGKHRYRVISNTSKALEAVPTSFDVDKVHREGTFHISIRQAETYSKGRVYLAGDAAHCHSPVGGRGMNLGIADAADLTRRIAEGDLENYTKCRQPEARHIIDVTERARKMIASQSIVKRFIFKLILLAAKLLIVKKRIGRFAVEL